MRTMFCSVEVSTKLVHTCACGHCWRIKKLTIKCCTASMSCDVRFENAVVFLRQASAWAYHLLYRAHR